MITEIEDYFAKGCDRCARFATPDCSTQKWAEGLAELRRICRETGMAETVKWGHPCYVHADRNIALIGALQGDFRLSFFEAALLGDPEGILEKPGPNTQHPNLIRFADAAAVVALEPVITAYLREAMGYAEAGIRAPQQRPDLELPEELIEALASDPELSEAFDRLTPGRQRSHAIVVGAAKKPETRIARVEKLRPKIFEGKGAQER